jgi:hypothetical protein
MVTGVTNITSDSVKRMSLVFLGYIHLPCVRCNGHHRPNKVELKKKKKKICFLLFPFFLSIRCVECGRNSTEVHVSVKFPAGQKKEKVKRPESTAPQLTCLKTRLAKSLSHVFYLVENYRRDDDHQWAYQRL